MRGVEVDVEGWLSVLHVWHYGGLWGLSLGVRVGKLVSGERREEGRNLLEQVDSHAHGGFA